MQNIAHNPQRAEGTGGDAQTAVVTAFDINIRQFVKINPHDGAHFAGYSRQTAAAGSTVFSLDLNANLPGHKILAI
jgi:hypothetical protein